MKIGSLQTIYNNIQTNSYIDVLIKILDFCSFLINKNTEETN